MISHMTVLGIDIGGSGIKGAPVDVRRGALTAERFRVDTPRPATPDAVIAGVGQVVAHFSWTGAVGITFPGVVCNGEVRTAVNLHDSWVGRDLPGLIDSTLHLPVVALNDADAAGVAEVAYGAAKNVAGVG